MATNWNEIIDRELRDSRGDLKYGKSSKTLLVQPFFSRAQLYPQRETDIPEDPLKVHSKFSRFSFVIIDTKADTKTAQITMPIHRDSKLEYDIFHERMMDGIELEKPYIYGEKKVEAEEDRVDAAFSTRMVHGAHAGKTPAAVLKEKPEARAELIAIYKELKQNEAENRTEMDGLEGGLKLLDAGLLGKEWDLPKIKSAYSVKLSMNPFPGKTPAEVLNDNPADEGRLDQLNNLLAKNADRYPRNRDQMTAIAAAKGLRAAVLLKQAVKASIVIFDTGFKPNKYKEDKATGLSPCSEMRVRLYHGDDSPFEIEIENYKAPVKETDDGRWIVSKKDAADRVAHRFRLSYDDMRGMIREMDRQVNAFFYMNYAKADSEASALEARRRKEAGSQTSAPGNPAPTAPAHENDNYAEMSDEAFFCGGSYIY